MDLKTDTILTFGELLLRLSLDAQGNWLKNKNFPFFIGGAELNVATALALWGLRTRYFTAMPDNHMSREIILQLQQQNIDTSKIHYDRKRIGIFYLTSGQDMKNDSLIYDRSESSFAELKPGIINWDSVLDGITWFHFSAICPAISNDTAALCNEALEAASQKGITISVDLNYRSMLWKYGKSPNQVMPHLIKYCDVIMGNLWAADIMLGMSFTSDNGELEGERRYIKMAKISSEKIMEQFPKCKMVANTFRFDKDGRVSYYATLHADGNSYQSKKYQSDFIKNKVGSGDCFMAGLIYGIYNRLPAQLTLEFAAAAGFTKLFIPGDATTATVAQIKNTINNEK
jgi:2-dehydro-3-deoxygluconokinase